MIDFNPLVQALVNTLVPAIVQALQQQGLVGAAPAAQPSYPQQGQPQQTYTPPQQQFQPPQQQVYAPPQQQVYAPPQSQYPFHDNVTAAAWAKGVWGQILPVVGQDVAMQKFGGLMQQLQIVDFDHLTPDKFPMLYQGVQQIKAELGIQG